MNPGDTLFYGERMSYKQSDAKYIHTMYIRHLMGSTDQADPSCFYFRIS